MDLNTFKNDEEIVSYLKAQLDKINTLNECRLFREEQMQLSEEILNFRNCIEWIIRSNQVISNIKFALSECLKFSTNMISPLEDTENKKMYSYYLEDAVYRDLVLWDMFRQLLNEFYKCGYSETESINIFKFIRDNKDKIGDTKSDNILSYLNSSDHKLVRETLRNSFTHSIEATSPYIFHRNINGKIQPQMEYILPNHPFENLNYVIEDIIKLIDFFNEIVKEMYEYRNDNFILLNIVAIMPCGKKIDDSSYWNLGILKEKYEQIIIPCETHCDKANKYNGNYVCKPIEIHYKRIHSEQEEIDKILIPTMTFKEMESEFGEKE